MKPDSKQKELKHYQFFNEDKFPTVRIPQDQFEAIKNTRPFARALATVQSVMSANGIDYRRPVSSWVDEAGNLCHKNFFDGRYAARLQATFPPRGAVA